MKIIDLEAHFVTETFVRHLLERKALPRMEVAELGGRKERIIRYTPTWVQPQEWMLSQLLDLEGSRLATMDTSAISMQVLSLGLPGCELLAPEEGAALARQCNDEIGDLIQRYPDRFVAWANLAPQAPEVAADELERSVKELGFKGASINSHVLGGEYLDEKKYWVIWERAAKLGVPVYLHPKSPSPQMIQPYEVYGNELRGPALGFAAEASLHALRLVWSGLFDHYPDLTIILGHLGEGLPFWLNRIDGQAKRPTNKFLALKPSDYIRRNFVITTSGMPFTPAFMCSYLALGADKIMFSSDYPYSDTREMVDFVHQLPICATDKEKIFWGNAQRLLGL